MIQAYVIIAHSRDIYGPQAYGSDGSARGSIHPLSGKLIYTSERLLSIILEKKFHTRRTQPVPLRVEHEPSTRAQAKGEIPPRWNASSQRMVPVKNDLVHRKKDWGGQVRSKG